VAQNPAIKPMTPPVQTQAVTSEEQQKFEAHFDELFSQENLPGPDYFEFSKMLISMAALPDAQKVPGAFAALSAQGLTKEKLVETADHYINSINKDTETFKRMLDTKVLKDIEDKKAKVEELNANITKKEQLIADLTVEIANDRNTIAQSNSEIVADEQRYNSKIALYNAAVENKRAAITLDIQRINQYIQ